MLIIARKIGESITIPIGDGLVVTVAEIHRSHIKLKIDASPKIRVKRGECTDMRRYMQGRRVVVVQ